MYSRVPKALLRISSVLLVFFMFVTQPVQAAPSVAAEAKSQLEATINQVLAELQKPGLHNEQEQKAILDTIENIIHTLFDYTELSARTVGPNWKTFSPDQQQRFIDAFAQLLRETYLEKLEGYNGETVNYTGEQVSTKGDKVEVFTNIMIQNKPVAVSYRMIYKNKWVVYDVVIEGISMVQNYRTQFQDVLIKGDAEALIKLVQDKAVELRLHNKKQQTGK